MLLSFFLAFCNTDTFVYALLSSAVLDIYFLEIFKVN